MPDEKPTDEKPASDASRPGMLGDGTEEQNLNQPGNPDARIRKEDVEAAFGDKPAGDKPKS